MVPKNNFKHPEGGSMTSNVIDLNRERRINALVDKLGATLEENPKATERTFSYLNGELSTMDKTAAARTARWKERKRESGYRKITVWVEPAAIAALDRAKESDGLTIEQTINRALTSKPDDTAYGYAKWLRDSGLTLKDVAELMNASEFPSKSGKPWTLFQVGNLFNQKQKIEARKIRNLELDAERLEAEGQLAIQLEAEE